MRTLSSGLQTAQADAVTRPGYLIVLYLPTQTLYLSTVGDVTWNGQPFTGQAVTVQGLGGDAAANTRASLMFQNTDLSYAAMFFGADDIRDRRVVIYGIDAAALGASDPVLLFDGVGNESVMTNPPALSVSLVGSKIQTQYSPRRRIAPPLFNALQPDGTVIQVGQDTYTLTR